MVILRTSTVSPHTYVTIAADAKVGMAEVATTAAIIESATSRLLLDSDIQSLCGNTFDGARWKIGPVRLTDEHTVRLTDGHKGTESRRQTLQEGSNASQAKIGETGQNTHLNVKLLMVAVCSR